MRRHACPTCGSRSVGSLYAPCSMGGSSEQALPSHVRFPNADPWHLIALPEDDEVPDADPPSLSG